MLKYLPACFLLLTLPGRLRAQTSPSPAEADRAYAAFNQAFYDPQARLYYGTTNHKGVAAIWTQAIYWDMAMNGYERTRQAADLKRITDLYEGNGIQYAQYDWTNHKTWFIYDDMMWWVMAFARAHKLTKNPAYLQHAVSGFNHVWEGSYDPVGGGMFWDFKHSGKNACINYPTVIAALRLYDLTGDTTYLGKAKRIYAWARTNLFDGTNGRVADHKIGNGRPGFEDYTYNQGTCIGAATGLYAVTRDETYLADAKLAADYTQTRMSRDGILPAEGDFNEQGVLKAIFAQYMVPLATTYGQRQYLPWLRQNTRLGWQNRDLQRNLTYRNYAVPCPQGPIQSYEASSIVMLMQLLSAVK